jgi:hypothetical protein
VYESEEILVGRRIVKAEIKEHRWGNNMAVLSLDDGSEVWVIANEGCGGCSNGWYDIEHVASVDNIITAVDVVVEDAPGEDAHVYRIFVFTGDDRIEAVTVAGDDGNGYYGSGYYIDVVLPA